MGKACSYCGKKQYFPFLKQFRRLQENFYCDDCFPKARREYLENIKPIINKKLSNIYIDLEKFFSAGVLKVIFAGEYVCICNISNWCYIIFDYNYHNLDYPLGYALDAKYIEEVMKNEDSFYKWVSRIPESELSNNVIHCTDRIFEVMKEKKKATEANGPRVSLDYEQELIEKYGVF